MSGLKRGYCGSSCACACSRSAKFVGWRPKTVVSLFGEVRLSCSYYRCQACGASQQPWDAALRLGSRRVTAGAVFRAVLRRYFPLLGFFLLIVVMAIVFCLIPLWIWIWVNWIAVVPMMFVENIGLGAAMSRRWRLVAGRWWRTFLIVFLLAVLTYVVRTALVAFAVVPVAVASLFLSSYILLGIAGAINVIVDALVNPVLQIAVVLIYFDLRVRREGLDLFQMAHRLAARPATS